MHHIFKKILQRFNCASKKINAPYTMKNQLELDDNDVNSMDYESYINNNNTYLPFSPIPKTTTLKHATKNTVNLCGSYDMEHWIY